MKCGWKIELDTLINRLKYYFVKATAIKIVKLDFK